MAGAALLLSVAQLALLNAITDVPPFRAIVGSLNNAATPTPQSLGSSQQPTSDQTSSPATPPSSGGDYNIAFDVVTEEAHTDELEITDHPVEMGAAITDNAYKKPALVVLTCGFTNSYSSRSPAGAPTAGSLQRLYAFMLQIQNSRNPMAVYTGKRVYQNMLLKSIATRTNNESENSLPMTLVFREIIIVQTSATTVTTNQAVQAAPQDTTPTVNAGSKQLSSAPLYIFPVGAPGGPT